MQTVRSALGRLVPVVALLTAVLLAVNACGSSDSGADGAGGGDFEPVTISHAFGETVISQESERIVTLGQGSAETVLALDKVPVGVEEYPWGSDESGYLPWVHDEIVSRGAALPTQFTGATELDIEAIVELEPDLILAPWSGVTQDQYDLLSDIAPTVVYPELPWTITWQQQIETIGQALGKPDEAAGLITGINDQLAAAARPAYNGLTFSFIYNTGPGSLGVFLADEQRVAMVRALGLTVDPVVDTLEETEGTDSAVIGLENADLLKNSDLVFTFYSDEANRSEVEAQPLYKQIPAVGKGAIVAPTDQPFVTGSSMINPLTVPWALERYVPMIDAAVAKANG